jgi:hypothetical protein
MGDSQEAKNDAQYIAATAKGFTEGGSRDSDGESC